MITCQDRLYFRQVYAIVKESVISTNNLDIGDVMMINQLQLHDAIIETIIVYSNDSFARVIEINLTLENQNSVKVICENCFCVDLGLNCWILNQDSIRAWSFEMPLKYSEEIKSCKSKNYLLPQKEFKYMMINTNISNSIIEVVCEDIRLQVNS